MVVDRSKNFYFRRIDEVDFLRALAIIAVVSNHIFGLKGGFIGVDVFFVISGYVITLSILKDDSSFHGVLVNFFHHRIRRIIPPLFLVSFVIYLLAKNIIVDIDDYSFLTKSYFYQSLFAQNFYFAEQSAEYFHGLAEAKLNLHLWSIAVEEQFYIVFPFIFLLAYHNKNTIRLVLMLLIVSAISIFTLFDSNLFFGLNHNWLTFSLDKYEKYYLIYSRAWEFLIGAVACLFSFYLYNKAGWIRRLSEYKYTNQFIIIINIFTIVIAMYSIESSLNWPRSIAIAPVIATALLIIQFHLLSIPKTDYAVAKGAVVGGVLHGVINNGLFKYVGKSSYSIYLYHWPVFAILLYVDYNFGGRIYDYLIYFVLLFILTDLSYRALEKKQKLISGKASVVILLAYVVFCLFVGFDSFSKPELASKEAKQIVETGRFSDKCSICVESPKNDFIILWGDSHAKALVSVMEKYCIKKGWDLVFISSMPLYNEKNSHKRVSDLIKLKNYEGMILASRWSMYLGFQDDEPEETGSRYIVFNGFSPSNKKEAIKTFKASFNELRSKGILKKAVILLQVPRYPFFPVKEALLDSKGFKFRRIPDKSLFQHRKEQNAANEILYSASSNDILIVDPASILCSGGRCKWREGANLFYKDDDHLSIYGASLIMPLIEEALNNFQ